MQASLLERKRDKCSLGCPILDELLNGGIPCGSLTELVGESATGKTQLSLQLLLTVQLPLAEGGLHGSALYLYTESYFPSRRLQQLATISVATRERHRRSSTRVLRTLDVNNIYLNKRSEAKGEKRGNDFDSKLGRPACSISGSRNIFSASADALVSSSRATNPCNNVFVHGIQKATELLEYLDHAHSLLAHHFHMRVRLVVIDSIAALFRSDFDNNAGEMTERSCLYFKIASKLKRFAEEFNLAVVVTNQVMDYFEPVEHTKTRTRGLTELGNGSEVLVTSGRRVAAALGLSWAHCINTRLFLSRNGYDSYSLRRSMHVVFAPHLPNASCAFDVNKQGVRGIPTELDRGSCYQNENLLTVSGIAQSPSVLDIQNKYRSSYCE